MIRNMCYWLRVTLLYSFSSLLFVIATSLRQRNDPYAVPATRVLTWVSFSEKMRANPKSAILGLRSLSRRMLLALMSRCTIRV